MDYYNGNEYNHEEEMPVRCGIMHIRGNATETACKKDGKFFSINALDNYVERVKD